MHRIHYCVAAGGWGTIMGLWWYSHPWPWHNPPLHTFPAWGRGRTDSLHPAAPTHCHHLLQDALDLTALLLHTHSQALCQHTQQGTAGRSWCHALCHCTLPTVSPKHRQQHCSPCLSPHLLPLCSPTAALPAPRSRSSTQHEPCLQGLGRLGSGCYKPVGLMTVPSAFRVNSLWRLYSGWRHSCYAEPGSAVPGHCSPAPL